MADPRHALGLTAEAAVERWLTAAGWRVLARRYRSAAGGELDLVALDADGVLVAIEVRARRSTRAGAPAETVDGRRVVRLRHALAAFALADTPPHRGLRIDLVTVVPATVPRGAWRLARIPGIG